MNLASPPAQFDSLAAACEQRRTALLVQAKERNLQGFVVFGHGSSLGSGTRSHGALRYLTQWDGHESASLLVRTAEASTLMVGSPFLVPLAHQMHPELDIVDAAPEAWGGHLDRLLGPALGVATVGFAEMPQGAWTPLQAGLAARSQCPLDGWLDYARSALDLTQQAVHRRAAALCDQLFEAIGVELRRGLPAWRIQAELSQRALELGADYCRTWLTVAPAADYPRYWKPECLRVPQAGDQVLFGIMLTVDGHWGHGIRMGHLGQPNHAIVQLHAKAIAALEAGLAALRCGSPLDDVEAAMQLVLPANADASTTCFRYGHGLGHSYEEGCGTSPFPQWFGASSPAAVRSAVRARPDMLLELHPNVFVAGLGGAAIGEMVLVHENRNECLLGFPRSLADWS